MMELEEVIKEEWKVLEEFPNYSISSFGSVKNNTTGKTRKLCTNKRGKGYLYCLLPNKEGKYKNVTIHRLVAKAFIQNPENKQQVNHIDGNVKNNRVNNLEWCTAHENNNHAWNVLDSKIRRAKMAEHARNKIWSKESREKISKLNKGRIHTDITRKRMSDASKNKPKPWEYKKVRCVELNTIYNGITNATKDLGLSHSAIYNVLSGRSKTAGGYHWERIC